MYNRYKDDFYFYHGHRQLGNNCKDSGGHFNPAKVSWPWWQLSIRMLDRSIWASCFSFYLQSRFADCDLCRWPTELQQTRRGTQATWATLWSTTLSSPGWRRFADAGDDEEDWPKFEEPQLTRNWKLLTFLVNWFLGMLERPLFMTRSQNLTLRQSALFTLAVKFKWYWASL